jgi:hypothetical protein
VAFARSQPAVTVLSADDPVAVAAVGTIRAGDVAALTRLLDDHPGLVTSEIENTGSCVTSRITGFIILGRIAGYSDEVAQDAWNRGEREVVISAALAR